MSSYDVIAIGSGAGGGTLVRHLAPSGMRILLLERGDWLPREPENRNAAAVFVDNRYISPGTWYDGEGRSFQPQVHSLVGENDVPVAGCAHQAGTCRFGADPQTSVLDVRRMGAQAAQREPLGDETRAPVRR